MIRQDYIESLLEKPYWLIDEKVFRHSGRITD